MYKLLVRWMDNQEMSRNIKDVGQLMRLIPQLKAGVVHAQLLTPSGVTKEITQYFNQ